MDNMAKNYAMLGFDIILCGHGHKYQRVSKKAISLLDSRKTKKYLRNEVRTSVAMDLLSSTDRGVTEIATDLGYTNSSNFSRAFRARTGQTPSEFRNRRSDKL